MDPAITAALQGYAVHPAALESITAACEEMLNRALALRQLAREGSTVPAILLAPVLHIHSQLSELLGRGPAAQVQLPPFPQPSGSPPRVPVAAPLSTGSSSSSALISQSSAESDLTDTATAICGPTPDAVTIKSPPLHLRDFIASGLATPGLRCLHMIHKGTLFWADLLPDGHLRDCATGAQHSSPSSWTLSCKRSSDPNITADNGWKMARLGIPPHGIPLSLAWERHSGACNGGTHTGGVGYTPLIGQEADNLVASQPPGCTAALGLHGVQSSSKTSIPASHALGPAGFDGVALPALHRRCHHIGCTTLLSIRNHTHEFKDSLAEHAACYAQHGPHECECCRAMETRLSKKAECSDASIGSSALLSVADGGVKEKGRKRARTGTSEEEANAGRGRIETAMSVGSESTLEEQRLPAASLLAFAPATRKCRHILCPVALAPNNKSHELLDKSKRHVECLSVHGADGACLACRWMAGRIARKGVASAISASGSGLSGDSAMKSLPLNLPAELHAGTPAMGPLGPLDALSLGLTMPGFGPGLAPFPGLGTGILGVSMFAGLGLGVGPGGVGNMSGSSGGGLNGLQTLPPNTRLVLPTLPALPAGRSVAASALPK